MRHERDLSRKSTAPAMGPLEDIGSALCLRCGICCRGVLHPDALLDETERTKAERYGLTLAAKDDGQAVFALPCNRHDHASNGCTIYDARFAVCRIYAKLGGYDPTRTIWQQLTSLIAEEDARDRSVPAVERHAELLLQSRLLSMMCHRHFEHRMHKRLNADAPERSAGDVAAALVDDDSA